MSRGKALVFTVAAVLLPAAFLALVEVALRLAGVGYEPGFFIERRVAGSRVLTDNPRFGWRFFNRDVARAPEPFSIPAVEPADNLRVCILGESAAMGDPDPDAGIPRIVQAMLEVCRPDLRIEVVNAAMTAINSHVMLPIAEDCLEQGADALLVYAGNNEVVGPFGAGSVFGTPGAGLRLVRTHVLVKSTRLGQVLEGALSGLTRGGEEPRSWGGLELFLGTRLESDDPRLAVVHGSFRANLEDICDAAARRGVPVVLSTVGVNVRSCAPFASSDHADPSRRAEVRWREGERLLATGDSSGARRELLAALDLDLLRFRADSGVQRALREVADRRRGRGVVLADATARLDAASPAGIPGAELFDDHVHPNLAGNWVIARALVEALLAALPAPADGDRGLGRIPEAEACASRIGYASWKRLETVRTMRARRERPPFAQAADADAWRARIDAEEAALEPLSAPHHLRKALAEVRAMRAEHPDDWRLADDEADLLLRLGDAAGAAREREALAARFGHSAEAHFRLGEVLVRANRRDEALESYRRAIALDQNHFLARNRLGEELVEDGRAEEALPEFRAAVRAHPRFAVAWKNLGDAQLRIGRAAEAAASLGEAVRVNPDLASAHKKLGDALAELGRTDEAEAAYLSALRLNPGYEAAAEKLEELRALGSVRP
ncbi:MAG: tetratricopeptide repeat protein [Candidatus Eiseniibacteriota bacterium]